MLFNIKLFKIIYYKLFTIFYFIIILKWQKKANRYLYYLNVRIEKLVVQYNKYILVKIFMEQLKLYLESKSKKGMFLILWKIQKNRKWQKVK